MFFKVVFVKIALMCFFWRVFFDAYYDLGWHLDVMAGPFKTAVDAAATVA